MTLTISSVSSNIIFLIFWTRFSISAITGPVFYSCDQEEFLYSSAHCIIDCRINPLTDEAVHLEIMASETITGVLFGSCKQIQRKVVLTETWLFSTLPPLIEYIEKTPDELGCKHHWESVCRSRECNTAEPGVPQDYSWAANREFVDEYYMLDITSTNTPISFDSQLQIRTPSGFTKYSTGFWLANDRLAYLWEVRPPQDRKCTLKPWKTVECFRASQRDDVFCPSISLWFPIDKPLTDEGCGPGIMVHETLIYRISRDLRIVDIPDYKIESPDKASLVIQSLSESYDRMREDICVLKCIQLPKTKVGDIILLPTQFLKRESKTEFVKCKFSPLCKIKSPITLCAEGKLVGVDCSGGHLWWNVSLGYEIDIHKQCTSGEPYAGEVRIPLDHEILIVNSSGLHWETNLENDQSRVVHPIGLHDVVPIGKAAGQPKWVEMRGARSTRIQDTINREFVGERFFHILGQIYWILTSGYFWIALSMFLSVLFIYYISVQIKKPSTPTRKPREASDLSEREIIVYHS